MCSSDLVTREFGEPVVVAFDSQLPLAVFTYNVYVSVPPSLSFPEAFIVI